MKYKENDKSLDEINTKRVDDTKKRVIHALHILRKPELSLYVLHGKYKAANEESEFPNDVAHAINLLECAEEEMKWACEHFDWNDEICSQINDAVYSLGNALASLESGDEEDSAGCDLHEGVIVLSKVLSTLVRWFDDSVNVSEV